jgi:hypothetical protein
LAAFAPGLIGPAVNVPSSLILTHKLTLKRLAYVLDAGSRMRGFTQQIQPNSARTIA